MVPVRFRYKHYLLEFGIYFEAGAAKTTTLCFLSLLILDLVKPGGLLTLPCKAASMPNENPLNGECLALRHSADVRPKHKKPLIQVVSPEYSTLEACLILYRLRTRGAAPAQMGANCDVSATGSLEHRCYETATNRKRSATCLWTAQGEPCSFDYFRLARRGLL